MPWATFGEAQYESDLWDDLRSRAGTLPLNYRPTPGAEAHLPFDRAVFTPLQYIMRPRRPAASGLDPRSAVIAGRVPLQSFITVPSYTVNVLLQTKRPKYVSRSHPSTIDQWQAWGRPYYRVKMDATQHPRLMQLEQDTRGLALVRYATPCLHTWAALTLATAGGYLVEQSHFQSPHRIGRHLTYTYRLPQQYGVGFSEPEFLQPADLWDDLQNELDGAEPRAFRDVVMKLLHLQSQWGDRRLLDTEVTRDEWQAVRDFLGYRAEIPLYVGSTSEDRWPADFLSARESAFPVNVGEFCVAVLRLEESLLERCGCRWLIVG